MSIIDFSLNCSAWETQVSNLFLDQLNIHLGEVINDQTKIMCPLCQKKFPLKTATHFRGFCKKICYLPMSKKNFIAKLFLKCKNNLLTSTSKSGSCKQRNFKEDLGFIIKEILAISNSHPVHYFVLICDTNINFDQLWISRKDLSMAGYHNIIVKADRLFKQGKIEKISFSSNDNTKRIFAFQQIYSNVSTLHEQFIINQDFILEKQNQCQDNEELNNTEVDNSNSIVSSSIFNTKPFEDVKDILDTLANTPKRVTRIKSLIRKFLKFYLFIFNLKDLRLITDFIQVFIKCFPSFISSFLKENSLNIYTKINLLEDLKLLLKMQTVFVNCYLSHPEVKEEWQHCVSIFIT